MENRILNGQKLPLENLCNKILTNVKRKMVIVIELVNFVTLNENNMQFGLYKRLLNTELEIKINSISSWVPFNKIYARQFSVIIP